MPYVSRSTHSNDERALIAQVVEENKRQLCVYKLLSEAKEAWKWWDYAAGFAAECTMANGHFGDRSCVRAQLEKTGLQESAVDSCMGDSSSDNTHELLQVRPRLKQTDLSLAREPCLKRVTGCRMALCHHIQVSNCSRCTDKVLCSGCGF